MYELEVKVNIRKLSRDNLNILHQEILNEETRREVKEQKKGFWAKLLRKE